MEECIQYIIKAQQGDLSAFNHLIELKKDYIYRLALRVLMDHEHASDVTQEAFIRMWKKLHRFRIGARFNTWIYKIVINLCYDRLKSLKRYRRIFESESSGNENIAGANNLEKEIEDREALSVVQQVVKTLPLKQRLVFVLRDLEDMDIDEIAGTLKISTGAVKSHLYLARKAIREQCKQDV